nr:3'-5' exonuclease [Streptomyces europaeiscabiei]
MERSPSRGRVRGGGTRVAALARVGVGVAEPLLLVIRTLATEDPLLGLAESAAPPPRPLEGGVHIGTMFRFKGLEYQRMIIAGVAAGLVPREAVNRLRDTDPVRHRQEIQRARSLLFVAATRARDSVDVFWHGKPSPLLNESWEEAGPNTSAT